MDIFHPKISFFKKIKIYTLKLTKFAVKVKRAVTRTGDEIPVFAFLNRALLTK